MSEYDDVMGDDDLALLGEDIIGDDDVLGLSARQRRRRQRLAMAFGGPAAWIAVAAKRRKLAKQAARARAAAGARPVTLPGGKLLTSGQRMKPFGMGNVTLTAAGGTGVLTQIAQVAMQPVRLVCTSHDLLAGIYIQQITIGLKPQLVSVGELAASAFAPDSGSELPIEFDPFVPGTTVQVLLINRRATGDQTVGVSLHGPAAW